MSELARPLFVVGSPRSGTSLLRIVLTCHPRVLIPPECGFMIWLRPAYGSWSSDDAGRAERLDAFLDDLVVCRKFESWGLAREAVRLALVESRPQSYAQLCAAVYGAYGRSRGKRFTIWGDKNNSYLHHLSELDALFPAARFLHVVRDGRDVACSYREVMAQRSSSPYAPRLPVEIETIADEWGANVAGIADYLEALPGERARTVRYEELTSTPEEALREVCAWLGVEFEAAMLTFHEANRRLDLEPAETRDWKTRTFEPISPRTVGRHERALSASERAAFEQRVRTALTRFDYR